jgi:3D (Asp-Asp-Asp) domain-containing protein
VIEGYEDKGVFLANDTGGGIDGNEIDVFVGAVPLSEAYALGTKQLRVRIVND